MFNITVVRSMSVPPKFQWFVQQLFGIRESCLHLRYRTCINQSATQRTDAPDGTYSLAL